MSVNEIECLEQCVHFGWRSIIDGWRTILSMATLTNTIVGYDIRHDAIIVMYAATAH